MRYVRVVITPYSMRYPSVAISPYSMRFARVVITPYSMRYPSVAITLYSMRFARVVVSLTIDVSTVRMVANHRKWGLSVPYSGRRTVSHNLANVALSLG
jgi:hypothetical protein